MPFGPRRTVKRALREALARRIPLTPPTRPGSRAVAFVGAGGSGKTLCATRLAAAYAARSDLAVNIVDLQDGRPDGDPLAAPGTLNVVDTPAVSPGSPADVKKLATELRRLGSLEVHVAVPATLSAAAVRTLLDGLAPLKPAAIMLTHLDEVEHAGPVVNEAIARSIAISYTSDGSAPEGFGPADPAALAARVLA
jgi:flagellar biosynthesis GTPase FlhF